MPDTWSPRIYCRRCGDEITYLGPQAVTCQECRIASAARMNQERNSGTW